MNEAQFRRGFLTIAGRTRTEGDRKSRVFNRIFTGEKGVGRLAARKLAKRMVIESFPYAGRTNSHGHLFASQSGIRATIDWDTIERCATLEEIVASNAVRIEVLRASRKEPFAGTTIRLGPLRRKWDEQTTLSFLGEMGTIRPWPPLVAPLPPTFGAKLLFGELPLSQGRETDLHFEIKLEGDLHAVEPPRSSDPNAASWVVEVDSDTASGTIRYALAPSRTFLRERDAKARREVLKIPISKTRGKGGAVTFKARIYEQHERTWDRAISGVRVFMEGFRVLPYGETRDDWLQVDQDYTERSARSLLPALNDLDEFLPEGVVGESTAFKRNSSYMGAVLLTRAGSPGLEMLVNREGFVPGPQFDWLRRHVRVAVDLMSRLRYAATHELTKARREQSAQMRAAAGKDFENPPSVVRLRSVAHEASETTSRAREALSRADVTKATAILKSLSALNEQVVSVTEEMGTEQAMFRVLASVGSQLEAFSHEINSLLELSSTIRKQVDRLRKSRQFGREVEKELSVVYRRLTDLHHALERQAIYLTDVAGIEARRRRSRLVLRDRFDAALRLLKSAVDRSGAKVENQLPSDLRSPPMFPAEVVVLFTNLLSNAVKAAGKTGRIRIRQGRGEDEVTIIMENTGVAVDLTDAEKWFEPFRSTTAVPDAALGQGMGMGLTIVRSLLDEYGASARFVKPAKGFATAIEIGLPAK